MARRPVLPKINQNAFSHPPNSLENKTYFQHSEKSCRQRKTRRHIYEKSITFRYAVPLSVCLLTPLPTFFPPPSRSLSLFLSLPLFRFPPPSLSLFLSLLLSLSLSLSLSPPSRSFSLSLLHSSHLKPYSNHTHTQNYPNSHIKPPYLFPSPLSISLSPSLSLSVSLSLFTHPISNIPKSPTLPDLP